MIPIGVAPMPKWLDGGFHLQACDGIIPIGNENGRLGFDINPIP